MTLLCSRCGRALKASAIPEQKPGVGAYAALGPVCARLVGLAPKKTRVALFTLRRRKARSDARQLELPA